MGFDQATVQFLAHAKDAGISLDRVLTLGRQTVFVPPDPLRSLLMRNGIRLSDAETKAIYAADGYCEPLLKLLGAGTVDSMDVSPYEHATILQDLNEPWPAELSERFSLLIDAGTLEHVFNFPLAIRNCMKAIAPGGHFLCITPANNALGHGFYQFSPELYYRIFTPDNGFEIVSVLLFEHPWKSVWYEVADPAAVRSRVELVNRRPAYMIVCARKIATVETFAKAPVQSDYPLIYWSRDAGLRDAGLKDTPGDKPGAVSRLKRIMPDWVGDWYRKWRPFHPRYFRKVRC